VRKILKRVYLFLHIFLVKRNIEELLESCIVYMACARNAIS